MLKLLPVDLWILDTAWGQEALTVTSFTWILRRVLDLLVELRVNLSWSLLAFLATRTQFLGTSLLSIHLVLGLALLLSPPGVWISPTWTRWSSSSTLPSSLLWKFNNLVDPSWLISRNFWLTRSLLAKLKVSRTRLRYLPASLGCPDMRIFNLEGYERFLLSILIC